MENLKTIREKRNRNQLNVAINVGVSQEMISSYESGRSYPSAQTLIELAKFLDTSTDYLLGLTDNSTPAKYLNNTNLSEEEINLLNHYNSLSKDDKLKLQGYLDAISNYNWHNS